MKALKVISSNKYVRMSVKETGDRGIWQILNRKKGLR